MPDLIGVVYLLTGGALVILGALLGGMLAIAGKAKDKTDE